MGRIQRGAPVYTLKLGRSSLPLWYGVGRSLTLILLVNQLDSCSDSRQLVRAPGVYVSHSVFRVTVYLRNVRPYSVLQLHLTTAFVYRLSLGYRRRGMSDVRQLKSMIYVSQETLRL